MSEEIKSLKEYISTTKNEIFTTFKIETISNLIIYYEDLQQKVEQLENENEELKYLVDDSNTMKAFIVEHNKVEQLENIRKEAREYIKKNLTIGSILDGKKTYCLNSYSFDYEDLLNILNKGR